MESTHSSFFLSEKLQKLIKPLLSLFRLKTSIHEEECFVLNPDNQHRSHFLAEAVCIQVNPFNLFQIYDLLDLLWDQKQRYVMQSYPFHPERLILCLGSLSRKKRRQPILNSMTWKVQIALI